MIKPLWRHGVAALALLCLAGTGATAGEIADHGARADELMAAGDTAGALEALDQAAEVIWKASPLVFRKALMVESAGGFGIYVERPDNVLKPGEAVIAYAEPVGFAYGRNGVGGTEISLIVDFRLEDTSGKQLFEKEDFVTVTLPVRYHNREFQMTVTVNLTGLGEGDYVAKFHVRDKYSDKKGDFELPFLIRS